jgi:hypothetical protein
MNLWGDLGEKRNASSGSDERGGNMIILGLVSNDFSKRRDCLKCYELTENTESVRI